MISLSQLVDAIRQHNGVLLAPHPAVFSLNTPITVKCENGHTWRTSVFCIIRRKTWCFICKTSKPPSTDVLFARCLAGHIWEPTSQEILQDAQCPQCASEHPEQAPRLSLLSCLGLTAFKIKS